MQRAFAAGMLKTDPAPDRVYFVDDHFVPYTGARPVAKDWNTKRRRAPLVEVTTTPAEQLTTRDGKPVTMALTDETVTLKGYGPARQLTLFEHDTPVLQVLTSETSSSGRTWCPGCGPGGGSRTCSNTPPSTTGSTRSPATGWTLTPTPSRSPTRVSG
ncbi:MAG: hypothetical protein WCG47_01700 [Dermatophilaceae bacterium]